eukprot:m.294373 g.294373  ORF g.294373 m.294373 type:complete len:101 (-) comp20032_c0_seq2:1527-1829(-)
MCVLCTHRILQRNYFPQETSSFMRCPCDILSPLVYVCTENTANPVRWQHVFCQYTDAHAPLSCAAIDSIPPMCAGKFGKSAAHAQQNTLKAPLACINHTR